MYKGEVRGLLQFLSRGKVIVFIIIVVIIAGAIHFTSQPRAQITKMEQLFRDIVAPLQTGLMRVNTAATSFFASMANLSQLQQENEMLRAKVLSLQQQVDGMADYERENQWLREALDFRERESYPILVSEVIGRSPMSWFSTITINHGRNHGVESGMAVMSGEGIVGTVHNVSPRTATVILITDPQSAIGAMVQGTGDPVLIEGDPDYSGLLLARPLNRDVTLTIGDIIVSSRFSQLYPKGMPVGKVVDIELSRYELGFTAYIEPLVDLSRLEYVFLVLDNQEQEN